MRNENTKCAKSTEKKRLYYCSETKGITLHREQYWLHKMVCRKFDDMDKEAV